MMIALAPICAQLTEGGCKRVGGLIEFAAQREKPPILPAFFVVPTEDQAAPNRMSGGRDQKVTDDFSVFVVLDANARRIEAIAEDLKLECTRVVDAITGWKHPEASGATDYAGGRLVDASGGQVTWRLRFSTSHHLRKAS